ncbi:hypothetical protein AAFF_G00162090 [Aldrovandia affinis]|uniref:Uncharacterized protein n=1 Tax=Aldrovandia affinis TaxID=143900 RepID=A0AAD7RMU9_9TELE|nr:hypothetical protein AAFF_G00162090 [Aldrovandia affinis]
MSQNNVTQRGHADAFWECAPPARSASLSGGRDPRALSAGCLPRPSGLCACSGPPGERNLPERKDTHVKFLHGKQCIVGLHRGVKRVESTLDKGPISEDDHSSGGRSPGPRSGLVCVCVHRGRVGREVQSKRA